MKKILSILCLLGLLVSCGDENIKTVTTEQELVSYRLGNLYTSACCYYPELTYMYQWIPLPLAPYQPSASSGFDEKYMIGYVGVSQKNTFTFHVKRVNATPFYPAYYIGSVDITWDDNSGNINPINTPNYLVVTAWPTDSFTMIWNNGIITLTVKDRFGNTTWVNSYGWSFPYGNKPNSAYSPTVLFTMSNNTNCAHDLPNFDDDVQLDGRISGMIAKYGTTDAFVVNAPVYVPLTAPVCSMQAYNYNGTVNFQWHTGL